MALSAVCIWEASEIALVQELEDGDDTRYVLYDHLDDDPRFRHGCSRNGCLSLTLDQAKALISGLQLSVSQYEDIERELASYMDDKDLNSGEG